MKSTLVYIGRDVGKSVAAIIRDGGLLTDSTGTGIPNRPRDIQICGEHGSPIGFNVTLQYIIRSGDVAMSFNQYE